MRKLRELFGGNLARILEELAPIIREIVMQLLTDLLRRLDSPASVTPHEGDAGSLSSWETTALEKAKLVDLEVLLNTTIARIASEVLSASEQTTEVRLPDGSPASPGFLIGGGPTQQRPGA